MSLQVVSLLFARLTSQRKVKTLFAAVFLAAITLWSFFNVLYPLSAKTNSEQPMPRPAADAASGPFSLVWTHMSLGFDYSRGVAWGDANGDGRLDLAVANGGNYGSQRSWVFLNNGGTFSDTASWSTPDYAPSNSVAWGDFDGDGKLDLAFGNGCDYISSNCRPNRVYRNTTVPGGPLAFASAWTNSFAENTTSLVWGDVDGDGRLDLVAGNYSQPIRIYINTGAGGFNLTWTAPVTESTRSVALADYDGDGHLDIAVGNDGQPNRIYRNTSSGSVSFSSVWTAPVTESTYSVAWGDVDGDGDPDLAVGNRTHPNHIYRNDSGPDTVSIGFITTFASAWTTAAPAETLNVAWGDYNGDGKLDLAMINGLFYTAQSQVYRNDGVSGGVPQMTLAWSSLDDALGAGAWGDANGDGTLDLAMGGVGVLRLYLNQNLLLQSTPGWTSSPSSYDAYSAAWGDIDNDGRLDLAVGNRGGPINIYRNVNSQLTTAPVYTSTLLTNTQSIAWGDWNGDGYLDLAVGNGNSNMSWPNDLGQIQIYRNDHGVLTTMPVYTIPELGDTISVAWCDIDRDGKLDLAVGNTSAANRIYRNDTPAGSSTLTLTLVWTATVTVGESNFVCGDIDNDGLPDLATGYRIYHNDGTVGGLPQMSTIWTNPAGGFGRRVALGDMDGDGFLDLAVGRYDQTTQVFHNNGGVFSTSPVWESAEVHRTFDVAWGDVDGDGRLDLAVANASLEPSRVYHNEGGKLTPQAAWETPVNLDALTTAWGDVDGDGDLDLFFGNSSGHQIYYNSRAARAGLATTPYVSVVRPVPPGDANFFSAPQIWTGPSIPLTFTLLDAKGSSVRSVQAHYSPDGGGTWLPALPYTGTQTTNLSTTSFFTRTGVNNTPVVIPSASASPIIVSSTLTLTPTDAIADIKVRVNLAHTWDADLIITLIAPTGQSVLLFNRRDSDGDNLSDTVFDDSAVTPIGSGWPPYNGRYRPEQVLSRFDGLPLAGTWTLRIQDAYPAADGGTLLSWGVTATLNSGRVYTYAWDVYGSGFLGQSDDVLFRLDTAPAIVTGTQNAVPGPYQYSQFSAATFPFRVRGTQVQVARRLCFIGVCYSFPLANAIVYRLPYTQTIGAELIADAAGRPYHTDSQGYLQGRGELNLGDHLFALAPVTTTDSYRRYQTNGIPNLVGTDAYTVTSKGVQTLYVSAAHPLYLFDLDVSLEWDAHNDTTYLDQLKFNLQRASAYLYDFTNGQMALGNINVYQNADNWAYAHVIIRANNRLRPFSAQGGIVISDTLDPQHNVPTDTIIYSPGQVSIGATWNRYGRPGQDLGDDWPIILAHELGHYVLYHDDTYLGLKNGQLVAVDTCKGSAMGDLYTDPAATEFIFDEAYWLANCGDTLAEQTLHRNEWQTMKLWYPGLISPTAILSGPTLMPFDFTKVNIVVPMTPTNALADPTFYLNYQGGGVSSSEARAFLMREDKYVYDLGSPFGGQNRVLAHGAQPGDRLCVFDRPANQFGCEIVEQGDDQITMKRDPNWSPVIQLTPVTSKTLTLRVEPALSGIATLQARLFPEFGSGTPPVTLTSSGNTYSGTILLNDPTMTGHIQVWVNEAAAEDNPRRETIVAFSIGGNPAMSRGGGAMSRGGGAMSRGGGAMSRGGGAMSRGGGAPIVSPDGQMIFFTENPAVFQEGQFYTIQGMAGLPAIPPGRTVIGQGYRLSATPGTPVIAGSVSIQYLSNDVLVAGADENGLTIYFYDGTTWRDLPTTRNAYFNLVSAPSQGTGVYALMSSIQVPLRSAGWNLFAYPLQVTQTVTKALESIQNSYRTVYGYYAEDTSDPWKVYQVGGPDYLNDLTVLEPGRGYWISATQAITVYFSKATLDAGNSPIPSPPDTYYGTVQGNATFTPTAGMMVEARLSNTVCGHGVTQPYGGQTVYVVNVDADDVTGRSAGCGQLGRKVTLYVGGHWMSPAVTWDNSQLDQVNLSVEAIYLPLVIRR